jgi:hypothetical protein
MSLDTWEDEEDLSPGIIMTGGYTFYSGVLGVYVELWDGHPWYGKDSRMIREMSGSRRIDFASNTCPYDAYSEDLSWYVGWRGVFCDARFWRVQEANELLEVLDAVHPNQLLLT